ncbi:hypothetical protein [Micromonospora profundi]|uniref:hypothetical protein n=1 Tax=Micromonospora profundi TaxID=1420889 RepID=UPI0036ABD980
MASVGVLVDVEPANAPQELQGWLCSLSYCRRSDPLAFAAGVPDTRSVISNDPRAPWLPRVPHPADSSTLPIYMGVFFVLGLVAFAAHGLADGGEAS